MMRRNCFKSGPATPTAEGRDYQRHGRGHGLDRAGKANWADIFARAVRRAARESLAAAAGDTQELGPAHLARAWFVRNFPLLGAVAQHFKIIEDAKLCERIGVRIAAVNPRKRELLMNPGWAMDDKELRYIVAHMALHAGLMHAARGRGRDQFVWSVACDYCINDYLAEMGPLKTACAPPKEGLLHSPLYHGKSTEDIYDALVENPRATRKAGHIRRRIRARPAGRGSRQRESRDDGSFFSSMRCCAVTRFMPNPAAARCHTG